MVARWLGHGGAEQVRAAGGDPDELLAARDTMTPRATPARATSSTGS